MISFIKCFFPLIFFLVPYKPYALRTSHFKKAGGWIKGTGMRRKVKGGGYGLVFKLDLENFCLTMSGIKK